MKISELSRVSGASVPTIKYYVREGLLPPGRLLARNQADYDDGHVRRLRLIRVLMDVGGLGVAAVRDVLQAVEDPCVPMHNLLGVAHCALGPAPDTDCVASDVAKARDEVDRFLEDLGWWFSPDSPSRRALADTLVALRRLGFDYDTEVFRAYAEMADKLAARELRTIPTSRPEAVERVVVGTVVFEAALVALRRLAQANHSARRFGAAEPLPAK